MRAGGAGIVAAALLVAAPAAGARAADAIELRICNKTAYDVYFSLAGFDSESPGFQWRSKGWWKVEPAQCNDLSLTEFLTRHLFIHANSSTGSWVGDFWFCVHEKNAFDLKGDSDCDSRGDGYAARRFIHKTSRVGVYTLNFTDAQSGGDETGGASGSGEGDSGSLLGEMGK